MASRIPGGQGTVKLNSKGMRALMKSQEVENELVGRMMKVKAALPGSELEAKQGRTRVRAMVSRGSDYDEANTGDLSRALDLAGGERGTFTKNQLAARRAKRRAKGTPG
tara:strand:+ start:772 stop:1098 length:327 start_codon:yes stop_codon:yes gene_type:complete